MVALHHTDNQDNDLYNSLNITCIQEWNENVVQDFIVTPVFLGSVYNRERLLMAEYLLLMDGVLTGEDGHLLKSIQVLQTKLYQWNSTKKRMCKITAMTGLQMWFDHIIK